MIKILDFSYKIPYPKTDGGAISIANHIELLESLTKDVKVFTLNQKSSPENHQLFKEWLHKSTDLKISEIDNRIKPIRMFISIFKKSSYLSSRFYCNKIKLELISILIKNKFDVIFLEHLYLCHYINVIREYSPTTKIILRQQNIEHQLWEEIITQEPNFIKRLYLKHENRKLKKFENSSLIKVDGVVCLTSINTAYVKQMTENKIAVETIPISINTEVKSISYDNLTEMYHVGSMDWWPNIQGINWYLKNVHPTILSNFPRLKIHLGGKNMSTALQNKKIKNVVNHGYISDFESFENRFSIMFVPLISGSGIRVKILEAICKGKIIITTNKGAEGIDVKQFPNIFIANNANEFIMVILQIQNMKRSICPNQIKSNFKNNYGVAECRMKTKTFITQILENE